MITLMFALFTSYAVVGLACYEAGADEQKRRDWQASQAIAQYDAAMAPSRARHPGGRDIA